MCTVPTDYVSGGFYITKRVERPAWASKDLLPDRLFSASGCIGTFVPDAWCIEWAQASAKREHEVFDLTADQLRRLTDWVTLRFDESIGWPNVCFTLDVARDIQSLFLGHADDVIVFELGLHHTFIDRFCEAAEPPPPQPGFAPSGRQGVHKAVLKGAALAGGGKPLGFEPLQFDTVHRAPGGSWLCNGLETVVRDDLGIAPNAQGFIGTLKEACTCVDYISREDVPSESGLWLPWLIVEHA